MLTLIRILIKHNFKKMFVRNQLWRIIGSDSFFLNQKTTFVCSFNVKLSFCIKGLYLFVHQGSKQNFHLALKDFIYLFIEDERKLFSSAFTAFLYFYLFYVDAKRSTREIRNIFLTSINYTLHHFLHLPKIIKIFVKNI